MDRSSRNDNFKRIQTHLRQQSRQTSSQMKPAAKTVASKARVASRKAASKTGSTVRSLAAKTRAKAKQRAESAKKAREQHIVALDVGTENVKALIGKVTEDEMEIIGSGRAHQQLTDMQAGAISDIQAVVANCDRALSEAEDQAGVSSRLAVVGIAGELVKGTTINVRVVRKDPHRDIDNVEMERIISVVQEKAEQKAKANLTAEMSGKSVDIRMVNSALVGISIDGYDVTNPIGFKGRDVLVRLYTAFAPLIHIAALERTAQELDLELVAVAAEPFAVARSVLGDDPNASLSAILMDVGGGTTDIAVINEGGVQGTKMFGIGGRGFTKSISNDLGVDFDMAEKLKLAISGDTMTDAQQSKVNSALDKTCRVWLSGVELALDEFPQLEHLPNKILLCGGGASLDKVLENLDSGKWYQRLPFARRPTVDYITPDQVIGIHDKSGKVADHTFVTAMGLLRVGLDTMEQQDSPKKASSLKSRFDKILRI